jgi:hypothetical protein
MKGLIEDQAEESRAGGTGGLGPSRAGGTAYGRAGSGARKWNDEFGFENSSGRAGYPQAEAAVKSSN